MPSYLRAYPFVTTVHYPLSRPIFSFAGHLPKVLLEEFSAELTALLHQMLQPIPTNRPTVVDILRHPRVSQIIRRRKLQHALMLPFRFFASLLCMSLEKEEGFLRLCLPLCVSICPFFSRPLNYSINLFRSLCLVYLFAGFFTALALSLLHLLGAYVPGIQSWVRAPCADPMLPASARERDNKSITPPPYLPIHNHSFVDDGDAVIPLLGRPTLEDPPSPSEFRSTSMRRRFASNSAAERTLILSSMHLVFRLTSTNAADVSFE